MRPSSAAPSSRSWRTSRSSGSSSSTPRTTSVRPRIGVRVKLFSEGSGRWSASAGEKSKFGLFITEILELFNVLKSARHARLPAAGALPPGQPAAGHPPREGRHQRARARVRGAEADGRGPAVHRRRRRPGRRLRRQRHQLLLLDELHPGRVRQRCRLPHRQRLQRARHPAPDDRERVRPRGRRLPQRAHLRRAGLLRARQVPGHRRSRPRLHTAPRSCRSRCSTCSTPTAR